jgi:hypothetical protein
MTHLGHGAAAALIAGTLLASPAALAAQAEGTGYLEVAGGLALKAGYGVSNTRGPMLGFRAARFLLRRVALRIEAEAQIFDARAEPAIYTPPCLSPGCVSITMLDAVVGAGKIGTVSALASVEVYEQADRRGFYLVAGLGPQFLASHPDRSPAIRLAAQVGAGLSLGGTVRVEGRYQATLGALAEPRHVVLLSLGLRYNQRSRSPV